MNGSQWTTDEMTDEFVQINRILHVLGLAI